MKTYVATLTRKVDSSLEEDTLHSGLAPKRTESEVNRKKPDAELAEKQREIDRLKRLLSEHEDLIRKEELGRKEEEEKRRLAELRLLEEKKKREKDSARPSADTTKAFAPITNAISTKKSSVWDSLKWNERAYTYAKHFELVPPNTSLKELLNRATKFSEVTSTRLINVLLTPFAKGNSRSSCYMHDMTTDQKLVAKQYLAGVTKNANYFETAEILVIGKAFAKAFNALAPPKPVHFVSGSIYHVADDCGEGEFLFGETWLEGSMMKYNNNYGAVSKGDDFSATSQAFSHFTYHASGGQCCIVDLLGFQAKNEYYYLTPVIHTKSESLKFYDQPKNLGQDGIAAFFRSHSCNKICMQLKLETHALQPTFVRHLLKGTVMRDD